MVDPAKTRTRNPFQGTGHSPTLVGRQNDQLGLLSFIAEQNKVGMVFFQKIEVVPERTFFKHFHRFDSGRVIPSVAKLPGMELTRDIPPFGRFRGQQYEFLPRSTLSPGYSNLEYVCLHEPILYSLLL